MKCKAKYSFKIVMVWCARRKKNGGANVTSANVTTDSRLVTHDSTNVARARLTAVGGREPVYSRWYERWRQ